MGPWCSLTWTRLLLEATLGRRCGWSLLPEKAGRQPSDSSSCLRGFWRPCRCCLGVLSHFGVM